MFLRLRWFVLGVLSTIGGGAWVLAKLRSMRARLTPANVRRASALVTADALDWAGRRFTPPGHR